MRAYAGDVAIVLPNERDDWTGLLQRSMPL